MAGRTSAGVGVGVAITVLAVLCAALFVLTMVFYSQKEAAVRQVTTLEAANNTFVKSNERESASVREVINKARGKSAITYLMETNREMMKIASGRPDMSLEEFQQNSGGLLLAGESLQGKIRSLTSQIQDEQRKVADAMASSQQARQDADTAIARVKGIEQAGENARAELQAQVSDYQARVDQYRSQVDRLEGQMRSQLDRRTEDFQERERTLAAQNAKLQEELLLAIDQLDRLRGVSEDALKPKDEYALVDGNIIEIRPTAGEVVIDLGRQDKVVLGQTFSVYRDGAALSPDLDTGEYNEGKAVIEIVDIRPDTSRARIVRESRGNPIVRGDIIANPVYDPKKEYTFVVYGEFDANQDGLASRLETAELSALIKNWGGNVQDELTGGVDFLVMGRKPLLPPQPGPGAPIEVLQEYVRLQRMVARYDDLFKTAIATSIPVLNENRLYTLIGAFPD